MTKDKNVHFAGKYFEEIDQISEKDNYFTPVLQDVLLAIDVKSASILDVGCGTGLFLKPLISAGCTELYGVDGPQGDHLLRQPQVSHPGHVHGPGAGAYGHRS